MEDPMVLYSRLSLHRSVYAIHRALVVANEDGVSVRNPLADRPRVICLHLPKNTTTIRIYVIVDRHNNKKKNVRVGICRVICSWFDWCHGKR
jgi:hypothetical protein